MSTTTIAGTRTYELHDTTLLNHAALPPIAPSRLINEIRPASLRSYRQEQSVSGIDVGRIPDVRLTATNPTKKHSAIPSLIILQVSIMNFLTSVSSGLIVVGLSRIAADLDVPEQLYLWPTSVYGLTAGSTLLLAGAIADVVGPRWVELIGCALLGVSTLACGSSHTGINWSCFVPSRALLRLCTWLVVWL